MVTPPNAGGRHVAKPHDGDALRLFVWGFHCPHSSLEQLSLQIGGLLLGKLKGGGWEAKEDHALKFGPKKGPPP